MCTSIIRTIFDTKFQINWSLEFWVEISKILIDFSVTRHVSKQTIKCKQKSNWIQHTAVLFAAGNVNNDEPWTRIKCKFKDNVGDKMHVFSTQYSF